MSARNRTAGGGGYGDPRERDPALVLDDMLDGFLSVDDARRLCGVAVDPATRSLDEAQTRELRQTG